MIEFILTYKSFIVLSLSAGLVGTIAMTTGQLLEIKFISHRKFSYTPAIAISRLMNINFEVLSEMRKSQLNYLVHFTYGTMAGLPLFIGAVMISTDNSLFQLLNLLHIPEYFFLYYFAFIWLQGLMIVPLLAKTDPPWKWGTFSIATDAFHHLVYTSVAFYSYFYIVKLLS